MDYEDESPTPERYEKVLATIARVPRSCEFCGAGFFVAPGPCSRCGTFLGVGKEIYSPKAQQVDMQYMLENDDRTAERTDQAGRQAEDGASCVLSLTLHAYSN